MDRNLVRQRLQGYRLYNEWEQQAESERLPQLTIEASVQQYLALQSLMRQLAPDAQQIFFEESLAERVEWRKTFKRIATAMKHGSTR